MINEDPLPSLVQTDSEDVEEDPDDEVAEDTHVPEAEDEDHFDIAGDGAEGLDFLDIRGIEKDEVKHKAKWETYLQEKEQLIDEGYTVIKKPPKQEGIGVGSKVAERFNLKRNGVVVDDDREDGGRPRWAVLFDDTVTVERNVPSTGLGIVKDKREFKWKVVRDSIADNPVVDYQQHGVVGFDFAAKFESSKFQSEDSPGYDYPFLSLLQHLWPGNWRTHLLRLNTAIENDNSTQSNKRKISIVSGGKKLFQSSKEPRRFAPVVDLSIDKEKYDERTGKAGKKIMSWDRFKKLRERMYLAFYDDDAADPWHPIKALVVEYNDNRKKLVAASVILVLDEAMCNFQPRTTKSSLLPFLSFIFRKPKPLGVEYKVIACTKTGITLGLEIQRGKIPMKKLRFFPEVGSTAACSLRMSTDAAYSGLASKTRRDAQRQEKRHLILGDSWFGSVKLAETMQLLRRRPKGDDGFEYMIDRESGLNENGFELIAAVKTNHAYFPKKALEKKMKAWPSGSYLVMECCTPETNV
ncbi:MAG: hypothetical protein SGARI_000690, partial [Bacillariaceae sp.]